MVILAIISHYMGTDEVVAYCMVYLMVGVTSSFMGSWVDAISSLGSMAYGAKNYDLLAQYLKVSCLAYTVCEIPCAITWYCIMDKVLLLMQFNDTIATLGKEYVWVAMSTNIVSYWNSGIMEFLEVIGHATYCSAMYIIFCFIEAGLLVAFALLMERISLVHFGLVMLFASSLLFALNIVIPAKIGWLRDYEDGLLSMMPFKKMLSVAKSIFKVALPLAFGNLLSYAEWEILTVLAAMLGPAEAATWAVLGYVWGFFESTTNAIGSASELRVAYHLGDGQPDMAKLSAYKSILLAAILTGLSSVVLMSLVHQLPPLLTYDPTIQGMLIECFPLIALGNVTMSIGMVCWAIVGAQGRYRLSTTIATSCAFCITIPVGAILTIWIRIDLQGLIFAVVVGYTITAMLLSLVVLTSDWKTLSDEIEEEVGDNKKSQSDSMVPAATSDASLANEIKDVVDSFDEFEKSLHVVSFQHPPTGKDVVDNFDEFKESLVVSPQHPPEAVDEDLSYLEFLKTLDNSST
jgi:Na+-driven multidrug efflux pump